MSKLDPPTAALAARIGCIADLDLRVRYLRSTLASMSPHEVAALLTVCLHGAEGRDPAQSMLLLACCVALANDASICAAVASAARADGRLVTAAMLTPGEPTRAEESRATPDFGLGRPVTLGERKSLARRRDRELLARVLRDPDPSVIRVLLGNPALTEDHVIRLCAQRPVEGDVLREVFRAMRWIVRYRVRRSIVLSPFAPIDLALQLAPHLDATDARTLASDHAMPDAVREICRRVAGIGTLH